MIKHLLFKLYQQLPKRISNKLGQSSHLKFLRRLILKDATGYKTIITTIDKTYLTYRVQFQFKAAIKVAARAEKHGIENKLLTNSLVLCDRYFKDQTNLVVMDVGANFGYLSLVWAHSVAKNGTVYAFEPNKMVCQSLMDSAALNSLEKNLDVFNIALGSKKGFIELYVSEVSSNISSNAQSLHSYSIEMNTIDGICRETPLAQCHLIKIDVDGIELDILQGSLETLKRFQPIYIVETNADRRIIEFFIAHEYQVLDMDLKPYETHEPLPWNIFAIPKAFIDAL